MNIIHKILTIGFFIGLVSCENNKFDNSFEDLPDQRVQETIKEYKEVLTNAPYGWQLTYSLGAKIEYISYQIAYFKEDNTVTLHSPELEKPIESEYKLTSEGDIELIFNTFNENMTVFSYPDPKNPNGYGGDIEFNFKSVNKERNKVILKGKVYNGILTLRKAKEEFKDFKKLQEQVKYLNKQRTARHMNLAITEGLEGTSEEQPYSMGLDLSSMAKVCDYAFNYKGKYEEGRKMLYFNHSGMGISTPIEIDGHKIQDFKYNKDKKRYELVNSELKGYIYCSDLPVFYVPGVVDEFLSKYSLWMRASFGKVWDHYIKMKRAIPNIKSFVITTDYSRRIPLFDEDGNPVLDDYYNHDYKLGEKLGNGFLFSFERYNQFYFYFVPIEIEKLEGDRLRFKRKDGETCITKEEEQANQIAKMIRDNKAFNEFIQYLCNDSGWYIKRTIESGQIDWDFISQENPKKDYFYTRLK